jgi:hypothetical protein
MVQKFKTEKLDQFLTLAYSNLYLSQKALSTLRTLHAMYGAYIPHWQLKAHSLMNTSVAVEVQFAYSTLEGKRKS